MIRVKLNEAVEPWKKITDYFKAEDLESLSGNKVFTTFIKKVEKDKKGKATDYFFQDEFLNVVLDGDGGRSLLIYMFDAAKKEVVLISETPMTKI